MTTAWSFLAPDDYAPGDFNVKQLYLGIVVVVQMEEECGSIKQFPDGRMCMGINAGVLVARGNPIPKRYHDMAQTAMLFVVEADEVTRFELPELLPASNLIWTHSEEDVVVVALYARKVVPHSVFV